MLQRIFKRRKAIETTERPPTANSIAEVVRKGHEALQREMDTPPVVPEDVRAAARIAGGMQHSLFFFQYVEEAVVKAYKRGFEDGSKGVGK